MYSLAGPEMTIGFQLANDTVRVPLTVRYYSLLDCWQAGPRLFSNRYVRLWTRDIGLPFQEACHHSNASPARQGSSSMVDPTVCSGPLRGY